MSRVHSQEVAEAEELILEMCSWTETEVNTLPKFYQKKAEAYRRLANCGDG